MLSGFGHLAWDSTKERTDPRRRRSNADERILTTPERNRSYQEKQPERKKQHGKHTSINMAYDAQTSMMHARFKYAWHGKVHKQHYKLSVAQYATSCILTKHHIYNYLVDSRYL